MRTLVFLLLALPLFSQEPGPVWLHSYARLIPGQESNFWKDYHDHGVPILAEAKKAGIFLDYKIYVNTYKTNPQEWDVLIAVAYKNMAALDDLEGKAAALYVKHFGSKEKVDEFEKERAKYREVTAVRLVREVYVK